ncbi:3-phosphoshikimate 1-carboxyvinyltransferase [Bacillus sp. 2205SS5-2]|uniref:3-phosphoshikimate 1-carboxyvinyltransferase n=1 Tax=Bacillus sp. 2205SS5-2 TaxID=3109031 RepID=UPI0030056F86
MIILKKSLDGLKGEVMVPGDKSISHRAVMFGAIAEGKTEIRHFLRGEDCLSTVAAFRELGVRIEEDDEKLVVYGDGLDALIEPLNLLHMGNSGTTTRLLMGLLAGRPFHSIIIGDESIAKRPMKRVVTPLAQMGAKIDGRNKGEYAPLAIRGGGLTGITYEMPVASAQVKSAILFAGLQANGNTTIIEPMKSRDHTERMIEMFGGKIQRNVEEKSITISGGQALKGTAISVPGDISSAAFFLVGAAITPGSHLTLKNVGLNPTRTGILNVLKQMGAQIEITENEMDDSAEPWGDITMKSSELSGITIEGDMIPTLIDELPVIALLATQAVGTTIIKDASELKLKETNRIEAVVDELSTLGANIRGTDDGMIIEGKTLLHGGSVSSRHDHRIGMMLAIASLITKGDIHLTKEDSISISYPDFFKDLHSLV